MKRTMEQVRESATTKRVYKLNLFSRTMLIILSVAAVFVLGLFAATAIVENNKNLAVRLLQDKDGGISLSETSDFENPTTNLNVEVIENFSDMSVNSIPLNVNDIDGSHNGNYYIAYTFYIKNMSEEGVTYDIDEKMMLLKARGGADDAVRIRVYRNGIDKTYAKTASDGMPEFGTVPFIDEDTIYSEKYVGLEPGQVIKYTLVIWLEGDDPECIDGIKGGTMRMALDLTVSRDGDTSVRIPEGSLQPICDCISIIFNKEKNNT